MLLLVLAQLSFADIPPPPGYVEKCVLSNYAEDCKSRWKVAPRPEMADLMYGSKKLYGASNIVFSNGLLDPWSSGGVLKTLSKSVVSLIIPEGAHHLDLRAAEPNDPASVVKARQIERAQIRKWIAEAEKNAFRAARRAGPSFDNIVE